MSDEKDPANVAEESNMQPEDQPEENLQPSEDSGGDPPDNTGGNTVISDI